MCCRCGEVASRREPKMDLSATLMDYASGKEEVDCSTMIETRVIDMCSCTRARDWKPYFLPGSHAATLTSEGRVQVKVMSSQKGRMFHSLKDVTATFPPYSRMIDQRDLERHGGTKLQFENIPELHWQPAYYYGGIILSEQAYQIFMAYMDIY